MGRHQRAEHGAGQGRCIRSAGQRLGAGAHQPVAAPQARLRGAAAGQYAESVNVPWVGYDSNSQKFAPKQWLTAATYNWGPYYLKRTQAAMNGTWQTGSYYGALADGFVELAPFGSQVSAATKAKINAKLAALKKGTFFEFSGPIYKQDGSVGVAAGKKLSLGQLMSIDWLVKGVVGSPKG